MEEIWKRLSINNQYEVSNLGKIRRNNKILNGWTEKYGYIRISINGKKVFLHRLIAETFISNFENKSQVNHIDGNKKNNAVENLEWTTAKENMQHAFRIGLMDNLKKLNSEKKYRAKNIKQYDLNNNYIKTFRGSVEAEKQLKKENVKVNLRNIRSVCEGKRKTAGGYIWRYENE